MEELTLTSLFDLHLGLMYGLLYRKMVKVVLNNKFTF